MKICDVTQFYSPVSGGVKRYISEKRRYIETHTEDEHYLVIPGSRTEHIQEGRLHTYTVQSPQINRTSRYRILLGTRRVRDFLDEIRPDVIESGDPYHLAWSALRAGRELHIPVLGFYHSHFPEAMLRTVLKYCGPWMRDAAFAYAQDYLVKLYSQFHTTLVPSDHLRLLLRDWGVGNAATLSLGVDTDSFKPGERDDDLRRELAIPDGRTVLLYVGRLSGDKNIATLLAAFRLLCEREPEKYHLVIIGDGPLRRMLPAVRRATGAITWRHYLNDNELLARIYHVADLFVHPGVCETFGLVILEAQACGCPAAGIHGSYMDANVKAGLEHWARENTPVALADAVHGMCANEDLPALGAQASETVCNEFAWTRVFARLWEHYRSAKVAACPVFYGESVETAR